MVRRTFSRASSSSSRTLPAKLQPEGARHQGRAAHAVRSVWREIMRESGATNFWTSRGRPSVAAIDILRAYVVLLHASMEDLLRSVLAWKLPSAKPEHLEEVPLVGETIAVLATPRLPLGCPARPLAACLWRIHDGRNNRRFDGGRAPSMGSS
jgi:hypothetical protein